jgi:hypothetical protein
LLTSLEVHCESGLLQEWLEGSKRTFAHVSSTSCVNTECETTHARRTNNSAGQVHHTRLCWCGIGSDGPVSHEQRRDDGQKEEEDRASSCRKGWTKVRCGHCSQHYFLKASGLSVQLSLSLCSTSMGLHDCVGRSALVRTAHLRLLVTATVLPVIRHTYNGIHDDDGHLRCRSLLLVPSTWATSST